MSTLLDTSDKLDLLPEKDRAAITLAANEAMAAHERLEAAKRIAFDRQRNLESLRAARAALADRIALCDRDWTAEVESHEATVTELFGRRYLAPSDRSRLDNAIFAAGHAPVLRKIVPGLRKRLEAELATLDDAIAEIERVEVEAEQALV